MKIFEKLRLPQFISGYVFAYLNYYRYYAYIA